MTRRKAVYFQAPLPAGLHPTRYIQQREFLARLAVNFDVVTVSQDCHYHAMMERHQPDIALFDSGNDIPGTKLRIAGVGADSTVPKVLMARCDPYAPSRLQVLEDCDHWQADAVFTYDPLYRQYLPDLAEILYFMPHSIDPAEFNDPGLGRPHQVTIFGRDLPHRRWRQQMLPILQRHFLCTLAPHDMRADQAATRMTYGSDYARLLAQSRFVAAEGSIAELPVRKFFEVPACGAVLVTAPSPSLSSLGFKDMENCIIADAADIVTKIDLLQADLAYWQRVADAGRRLVNTSHTHQNRRQLAAWLEAWGSRAPGERVVQTGLLAGFISTASPVSPATMELKHDRALLAVGLDWLLRDEVTLAEATLRRCTELLPGHHAEALFFLGLCHLLRGDPQRALHCIMKNFVQRSLPAGNMNTDPLEAAWGIVAYLCNGQPDRAAKLANLQTGRRHPDLDRAIWLAGWVMDRGKGELAQQPSSPLRSLYAQWPLLPLPRWLELVARMGEASGQFSLSALCRRLAAARIATDIT